MQPQQPIKPADKRRAAFYRGASPQQKRDFLIDLAHEENRKNKEFSDAISAETDRKHEFLTKDLPVLIVFVVAVIAFIVALIHH